MRNLILFVAAATVAVPATFALPTEAAQARRHFHRGGYYRQGYDNSAYYGRGYGCRRSGGTTGLIVGGAAGALLGRAIDDRGDRATGTIIGAGAGALLGREIERGRSCR
jgi:hypothetical protein